MDVKAKTNNFIDIYNEADPEGRFELLMDNYANVPKEIRKAEKKLQFKIKAEQEWIRSHSAGELGVRVNSSKLGDPTANEAISNVMMEEAFETGNLDKSILCGISNTAEYEEEFRLICHIKMDYELLMEIFEGLPDRDAEIMKARFVDGKLYKVIAIDEGKTIEAIRRKIEKLCRAIKEEIIEYLEMSAEKFSNN